MDSPLENDGSDSQRLEDITRLLRAHRNGDAAALDQVVEALHQELRRIARQSRARLGGNNTMQTTAVVNEAYLKLSQASSEIGDRAHFLGIAGRAMRQIIIDYARARRADKRGGGAEHVTLDGVSSTAEAEADQLLLIDQALQTLARKSERLARVFEAKFFLGLDDAELADVIGTSKRTAQREWNKARALLADSLTRTD